MPEKNRYSLGIKTEYKPDESFEVYGKLTAETDFHSDPEVKAEIGFIKKF